MSKKSKIIKVSSKNIIKNNRAKDKKDRKIRRTLNKKEQTFIKLANAHKAKKDRKVEDEIINLSAKIREGLTNRRDVVKDEKGSKNKLKKTFKLIRRRRYNDIKESLTKLITTTTQTRENFNIEGLDRKKFLDMMGKILIKREGNSLFSDIDGVIFPLNPNNFEIIKKKIIEGDTSILNIDDNIDESDKQMINRFFTYNQIAIISYPSFNTRNNNEGAFFPYLVKDENFYNKHWAKYGIYTAINLDETTENCFVTALLQNTFSLISLGKKPIISDEMIENIKHNCRNRVVTVRQITEFCAKYKIKISINNGTNGCTRLIGKKGDIIKLGKLNNHYFHIDNTFTGCTTFYLENLDKVRKLESNDEKARKCTKIQKGRACSFKPQNCTSMKLIKFLYNNKDIYLNEISLSDDGIAESNFRDKFKKIDKLEYEDDLVEKANSYNRIKAKLHKIRPLHELTDMDLLKFIKDNPKLKFNLESLKEHINEYLFNDDSEENIIFFDVESSIDGNHKVYMICSCQIDKDGKIYNQLAFRTIPKFLSMIPEGSICYAHNLGYDISFFIPYLIIPTAPIAVGKKVMSLSALYYIKSTKKVINIQFKDSYPLISMPLSDFPTSFQLPEIKKEIINYKAYTKQSVEEGYVLLNEFCKDMNEYEKSECIANIVKWKIPTKFKDVAIGMSLDNIKIDHITYSQKYCEIDVKILAQGIYKFGIYIDELCKDFVLPKISLNNMISIPSIVNLLFEYEGCYDDVVKVSGHVREFMAHAVVGGRTMSNDNKKWRVIGNRDKNIGIEDLDKVSLYPSAMARFKGFVKGAPEVIKENSTYDYISKYSSYIVEIEIMKDLPHNLDFPLLSYIDNAGVRIFSNDVKGRIFTVGKTMLEDVIKFHEVEAKDIKIIRGYYYNKGYNDTITFLIKKLFDKRMLLKKKGNPMQMLIKLIMNSGYGKLIQKPIPDELRIVSNKDNKAMIFITKNHNKIKYYEVNKHNQYFIKVIKSDKHFNYTIQGIDILDMSKRIMNEIMCLAQKLKIKIFYQDTDSMHIETGKNREKLLKLAKAYYDIYNIELLGDGFEQFNTDFKDIKGKKRKEGSEPKSYEFIVLGKKSYIDDVEYTHVNNNNEDQEIRYIHNRMKGIPKQCFPKKREEILRKYLDLFEGREEIFDLAAAKAMFQRTRTWEYSICEKFTRKVSYKGKRTTTILE